MAKAKKPAKKPSTKENKPGKRLYTLEVSLIGGPVEEAFAEDNPVVSRTIQARGDQTLADLHKAIFDAFDRFDEHMYEFQFGKKPMDNQGPRYSVSSPYEGDEGAKPAEGAALDSLDLKVGRTFFYWFDFGDDWMHQIKVEGIEGAPAGGKYPKVTKRVGKSPPQYPDSEDEDFDEDED